MWRALSCRREGECSMFPSPSSAKRMDMLLGGNRHRHGHSVDRAAWLCGVGCAKCRVRSLFCCLGKLQVGRSRHETCICYSICGQTLPWTRRGQNGRNDKALNLGRPRHCGCFRQDMSAHGSREWMARQDQTLSWGLPPQQSHVFSSTKPTSDPP